MQDGEDGSPNNVWDDRDTKIGDAPVTPDTTEFQTPQANTGAFEVIDESNLATPTVRDTRHTRQTSRDSVDEITMPELSRLKVSIPEPLKRELLREGRDSPSTARANLPESDSWSSIASRSNSLPFRSTPDLHAIASTYSEPNTTLVVADGHGYFENVNLATPTVEHFSSTDPSELYRLARDNEKQRRREGKWGGNEETGKGENAADSEQAYRRHRGHRKTKSDASKVSSSLQRPWQESMASSEEPSRHRRSSSVSSIAESAGTAADATDSEYEEAKAIASRASSRRTSEVDIPSLSSKRLSSFAPIPQLNLNGSSSNLAHLASTPQSSPPRNGANRQTLSPPAAEPGGSTQTPRFSVAMATGDSAQSNASAATTQSTNSNHSDTSNHGETSTPSDPSTSAATNASSAAFEEGFKKSSRKSRKTKPSVLQKVVSQTRQRDLPPKEKTEERKHLKEYKEMLSHSRATDKVRRKKAEQKMAEKEHAAAQALSAWEKDILPNWKAVLRDEKLRDVWWSGTMPPRHRARLWQGCIGNGLALGKSSYARALTLVKSQLTSGKFPDDIIDAIELDISETLPQTKLFQPTGPLHDDLRDLLLAQSVFWSTTPAYAPGTSYLAAILLVSMPPPEAFLALVNLINKSLLKTFYRGSKDDIEAYYRVFNTLLADKMPKVYRNFVAHGIRPALYLTPWLTTVYLRHLGFDTSTRVMDIFVLEGDQFLFRLALAILQILEGRLFNPDHEELAELFRGEDRGARAIVAREHSKLESDVEPWEVYELLGVTEDAVFEAVRAMEWKEATFHRLLTRELPDADA